VSGSVHFAQVAAISRLADGVLEYVLALEEADRGLAWRAGQFISLHCGEAPDGVPILRSYSIANLPGSGELRLVIKLFEGGQASAWLARLRVGERVRFTGPMGFFVLELGHPGDVVFGATGVGIAPVLPMLRELVAREEASTHDRKIILYWGLRSEADVFWQMELNTLVPRVEMNVHISRPSAAWIGASGRIGSPILERLPELATPTFYLVGNGVMIREVKAALVERGVERKRRIRTEAFYD
jgi:ferredoxin-NADP reductase